LWECVIIEVTIKAKGKGNMNTKRVNEGLVNTNRKTTFGQACLNRCKEVLGQITQAKESILAEARDTLRVQEQLLRLAVNEAEALAFQTLYPQLVFPTLAVEKVQGAARWSDRQRLLA
jgi:hypothetical protein